MRTEDDDKREYYFSKEMEDSTSLYIFFIKKKSSEFHLTAPPHPPLGFQNLTKKKHGGAAVGVKSFFYRSKEKRMDGSIGVTLRSTAAHRRKCL
jgi:hypothetical protein